MDSVYLDPNHYGSIELVFAGIEQVTDHSISTEQLKSKTRLKEIVKYRHIAYFIACKHTELGLKQIGQEFGGRDHSTVIHGRDTVKGLIDLFWKNPMLVSPEDKEIIDLAQRLDHKFKMAQYDYAKIERGRNNNSDISHQGKDGQAQGGNRQTCSPATYGWDVAKLQATGVEERSGGLVIDNDEERGCSCHEDPALNCQC